MPLTKLVWYHPTLPLAHHCPRQVSPISKVNLLPVSWRAAMVLTRLSLCATLPGCLRGWHLRGTDHDSVTLFQSPTVLPECYHQMFCAAATLATWKLSLRARERGKPKTETIFFLEVHSSKPLIMLLSCRHSGIQRRQRTPAAVNSQKLCGSVFMKVPMTALS